MTITMNRWAFDKFVWDKHPCNGYIPWGYSVVSDGDNVEAMQYIDGEIVRETEKAVCVEYPYVKMDCNMNPMYDANWKCWIPKSVIVDSHKVIKQFDGGHWDETQAYIDECVDM
jgi:hypothetical protein